MPGPKEYYVYILTNKSNQVLYIGVTNDLRRRVYEHQHGLVEGFSKRYNLKKLVYYEITPSIEGAIVREKQLKNWHRQWKINLITQNNPKWKDLSQTFSNKLTVVNPPDYHPDALRPSVQTKRGMPKH